MKALIAIGIFLFALCLRIVGSQWGLPQQDRHWSYHPDEPIVLGYSTQIEPTKLDFDPDFYNYGTHFLTLSRIASDVVGAYGGETEDPVANLRRQHQAGRALSLLAGALIPVFVFLILGSFSKRFGAIIASLSVAVAPGLVVHSRFQTVDMVATMWLTIALWASFQAWISRSETNVMNKWVWIFGATAGLAAGTKYNFILILVALLPVAMALPGGWKQLGKAAVASFATFVLVTPGLVLHTSKFMRDFSYEVTHTSTGHGLVFEATAPGIVYHTVNLFEAYGTFLVLLGLTGLVWCVRDLRKGEGESGWFVGPILFFALFFLLIGRAEVKFLRYVFPLIPVLALGYGVLLQKAHEMKNWKGYTLVIISIFAWFGMGQGGFVSTANATQFMASTDPRDQALAEVKRLGGSVGVVSDPWFYTPPFYPEVGLPRGASFESREQVRRASENPQVLRFVPEDPNERVDWDPRLITELKPDWIVFSSFETDDLDRISRSKSISVDLRPSIARYQEFIGLLAENYGFHEVYGSGGSSVHDMMYIRPRVWLWKRLNQR